MKSGASFEPLFFLMRRTLVAAMLVFLPSYPLIAASALLISTVAMLTYMITVKPYIEASDNNLAIMNEVFVALFVCLVTSC